MPETATEERNSAKDVRMQIDMLSLQLRQSRMLAVYTSYFSVGAAFEVFSITLILTALLVEKSLSVFWYVLMAVYLVTGIGFVTFGILGFAKLKKVEEEHLAKIEKDRVVD